ncbi:FecCD family ABC transporter permease [Flexivirga caeni]|uniref:Iron ABC transporter permease n=1 Tax=Flexivirga caeni TaxID=2294115 RepID=A0A3M9M6Z6_9MICO|nr:iron chelate uptake ABC transporter family permease subunit [Flexivirga caeni]RNI20318.1 iron ABC transporter permease [Flexivirga caeni]
MSSATTTTRLRPALRVGRASWRVHPRAVWCAAVTTLLMAALLVVDLAYGDLNIPFTDVVRALLGDTSGVNAFIVRDVRLPEASVALLAGLALGLSGALIQTIARNPLASPDVIGVNAGAAAGAVGYIVLFAAADTGAPSGVGADLAIPLAAFGGALAATALLYAAGWRGGLDGRRLVLVGIGIAAALTACTSWLLVAARLQTAASAQVWLSGSLSGVTSGNAWWLLLVVAVVAPCALWQGSALNIVELGDDTAHALGVRPSRAQAIALLCAVLLAAVAVSAVGPIGFVAFVCPQIARRLVGTSRPPLLTSALAGAVLVLAADVITRLWLTGLAVGVVTSLVGAPYFIYLLIRTRRTQS